jgi:hypothetical protein
MSTKEPAMQWRFPSRIVLLAFASIVVNQSVSTAAQMKGISVALRFHVVLGMEATTRGVDLDSWVTAEEIRGSLLPEANRIWQPAAIEWTLAGLENVTVAAGERRDHTVDFLLAATRDADGRADPRRIRKLDKLLDTARSDGAAVDVYLVPYLGERSQGNASRKKLRVFVAQWTDKPSRGRLPPQRFRLVEPEPFESGSLARTLAHELGHVLGLRHPDQKMQRLFGRLMGGRHAGYSLTDEEIQTARRNARQLRKSLAAAESSRRSPRSRDAAPLGGSRPPTSKARSTARPASRPMRGPTPSHSCQHRSAGASRCPMPTGTSCPS